MDDKQERLLRVAFAAGAIADAIAVVPMVFPPVAALLWGFKDPTGPYRFAMGYGAALMLGWTGLLVWAYQRPLERRFVAALTLFVILGLVITEVVAVLGGHISFCRLVPTWLLQAVLLGVFASAYRFPWVVSRRPAT
jgi:hypothetical protein